MVAIARATTSGESSGRMALKAPLECCNLTIFISQSPLKVIDLLLLFCGLVLPLVT